MGDAVNTAFVRVVESRRLYGETFVTWFAAPELVRGAVPGQFVMLRCVEPSREGEQPCGFASLPVDPLLPRPMSIHRVRQGAEGEEWAVLYDVVGRGTAWLAARQPGDLVYAWGPLGRGFALETRTQHVLLVAGGIGVAPLVWLADEAVAAGKDVVAVLGAKTAAQVFPPWLLPAQVEVIVMTEDGSLGRRGLATEAFAEYLTWCDQAFACGPTAMFQAMADVVRRGRVRRSVQVLLEERMGCGTGVCYGCAIETRRGMRLVCKDGPMFELRDVFG
jgi:dihydroorotate dehydrogenase electron transfer subunit